jgi:hypothetical protein
MLDLDRFIFELDRLITTVHFYNEVYCNEEGINAISSLSLEAAKIIQLSVHNEIVLSTARLLFDGMGFESSGNKYEYLSLYNLASTYRKHIDQELSEKKDKILKLKETFNVKDYRDLVMAHNDKATITGQNPAPKHQIETETLLGLLRESRSLLLSIRLKVAKENGESSFPVSPGNVDLSGVGRKFVQRINKI